MAWVQYTNTIPTVNPPELKIQKVPAMIPGMAKKRPGEANDTTFKIRCKQDELELFRFASEQEGFGGTISTWMMYHLRNQAKEHEAEFHKQSESDGDP